MNVESYIQNIEKLLADAWNLPLTKGKAFVDIDQIKNILQKIKASLPNEILQAKSIVTDRTQIINDAKIEADNIVRIAKGKAELILSKDELVKQAELNSEKIINDAKNSSRNIKKLTNDYIENLLKNTDKLLVNNINDFRNTCHDIRSRYNN